VNDAHSAFAQDGEQTIVGNRAVRHIDGGIIVGAGAPRGGK
jgi:hypothetical protein